MLWQFESGPGHMRPRCCLLVGVRAPPSRHASAPVNTAHWRLLLRSAVVRLNGDVTRMYGISVW
jgi:hypothetical protein